MRQTVVVRTFLVGAAIFAHETVTSPALGWGGEGHYAVTLLALDAMEQDMGADAPTWLFTDDYRWRAAYQSRDPDRRRSTSSDVLSHENTPEHFLDVEELADFGLTLRTLPRLRYQFIGAVLEARKANGKMWDEEADPAMAYIWAGTAPYAAMEAYWKLRNDFTTIRLLEAQPDTARDPVMSAMLTQARANAVLHIGDLSHWIGDLAQPLHTTIHHHGWVGDNPNGYTTEGGIHGFIDSGVLEKFGLIYSTIAPQVEVRCIEVDDADPWGDILTEIEISFAQLEPLYVFERDDQFNSEESKQFILDRITHGADTLAGFIAAAWRNSEPSERDMEGWTRFEPPVEALK